MGGNLRHAEVPELPPADRIPAAVHAEIIESLIAKWSRNGGFGTSWAFPHSVGEKPDHGDIDILVASHLMDEFRRELAAMTWVNPETGNSYLTKLHHPGAQDSYICTFHTTKGVFNAQVDLIPVWYSTFGFAFGYFSWNDLGNLIGRIAHRRGMKFGHDGLWYVHRRGDRVLAEILVTTTFERALEYLGFDVKRWAAGFDTFEEMFQWVADSRFFEKCAYPLEHRNHRARARDKKRKTYNAFLEWIDFDGDYVEPDKDEAIRQLRADFPHVDRAILSAERDDDTRQAYKAKVNGAVVSELTGLTGKELGQLMNLVKAVLPMCEVLNFSDATIRAGITFAYQLYLEDAKVAAPLEIM